MAMRARLRRVAHPAGFKLREKAGGKAGVAAQIDQAHGFLEAQAADALAYPLLGDEALGGIGVRLGFVHLLAVGFELSLIAASLFMPPLYS